MAIKIKPSSRNTNKHTDAGMELLSKSVEKVGAIESISVTEEGTIISGHARKETFDKLGMKPIEVTIQPNQYPVIVRNDIKDNTKEYFEAQILANTTSKKNIDIDTELIEVIAEEYDLDIEELGVDVEKFENEPIYEDLIGEEKNKHATMKITFESPEQLQKAEIDIQELIDRKYKGAYCSVSCGEL